MEIKVLIPDELEEEAKQAAKENGYKTMLGNHPKMEKFILDLIRNEVKPQPKLKNRVNTPR